MRAIKVKIIVIAAILVVVISAFFLFSNNSDNAEIVHPSIMMRAELNNSTYSSIVFDIDKYDYYDQETTDMWLDYDDMFFVLKQENVSGETVDLANGTILSIMDLNGDISYSDLDDNKVISLNDAFTINRSIIKAPYTRLYLYYQGELSNEVGIQIGACSFSSVFEEGWL